jgi:hypothetical protein
VEIGGFIPAISTSSTAQQMGQGRLAELSQSRSFRAQGLTLKNLCQSRYFVSLFKEKKLDTPFGHPALCAKDLLLSIQNAAL